jgi:hypothetical protein
VSWNIDWTAGTLSIAARAFWLAVTLGSGGLVYLITLRLLGLRVADFLRGPAKPAGSATAA